MARKKDTPQKAALREMMGNYLKENNVTVKDGSDVNSIMRDMISIILEGALDQELDEELGYSKYDYHNKVLWSSFFVTLVAKKYRLATMLPFVPRMVCDSR